jgi:putative N6-adenine-specific DNA methylase
MESEKQAKQFTLFATCAFGLEAIVTQELRKLGFGSLVTLNGRVQFSGDLKSIATANVWLRCADRVFICMHQYNARTFTELFDGAYQVAWEALLPKSANFVVNGKCVKSQLMSVTDGQSIIKKAIAKRLGEAYGLDWLEENGDEYPIEFWIEQDQVSLCINTSGAGLNRRGYRTRVDGAPLKETLASALVMVSYWQASRILFDPFCGLGTIPIEAAMQARCIAPGLSRPFTAQYWDSMEPIFQEVRANARKSIRHDLALQIQATDISEHAITLARLHAAEAGVDRDIHFQVRSFDEVRSKYSGGIIITNPPYGERLGNGEENVQLYREIATCFKAFDGWSFYILTSYEDLERTFKRKADKRRKLFNGRIACQYYQFFGPPPPKKAKPAPDSESISS